MCEVRLLGPARCDQLRGERNATDHDTQDIVTCGIMQLVQVVQHEHERRTAGSERRGDERRRPAECGTAVSPNRVGQALRAGRDTPIRRGEHDEQRNRVIVEPIERDPRDRAALSARPLCQKRRLPIPRGRRHRDDPTIARARSSDEGGATDRAPTIESGSSELRVEQLTIQLDLRRDHRRGIL